MSLILALTRNSLMRLSPETHVFWSQLLRETKSILNHLLWRVVSH